MTIKVLLFSIARDRAGWSERTLSMPDGAAAEDIFDDAALRSLSAYRSAWRLAVNEEFVSHGSALRDGDVLAVIPPVSGG